MIVENMNTYLKNIFKGTSAKLLQNIINDPDSKNSLSFAHFVNQLLTKHRFFCQHEFFDIFDSYCKDFAISLGIEKSLYRARRMSLDEYDKRKEELQCDTESQDTFSGFAKKESFVPPSNKIAASRANNNGIPCLYAAESMKTAISEVRPYKGTYVSVAKIKIKRPLKLFNLCIPPDDFNLPGFCYMKKYPTWYHSIAIMFSIPYEKSNKNEYLVTQCISEYIRLSGNFDGISYDSSLNDGGINYAIFDCAHEDYSLCEPISSKVCSITKIDVEYDDK